MIHKYIKKGLHIKMPNPKSYYIFQIRLHSVLNVTPAMTYTSKTKK